MDKVLNDLIRQVTELLAFKKALKDMKMEAPELMEMVDEEITINLRALQHLRKK